MVYQGPGKGGKYPAFKLRWRSIVFWRSCRSSRFYTPWNSVGKTWNFPWRLRGIPCGILHGISTGIPRSIHMECHGIPLKIFTFSPRNFMAIKPGRLFCRIDHLYYLFFLFWTPFVVLNWAIETDRQRRMDEVSWRNSAADVMLWVMRKKKKKKVVVCIE